MATAMKRCSKCDVEKPATAEYFHCHTKERDGLRSACKDCVSDYRRKYRKENLEREKKQQREHYSNNRWKVIELKRRWRTENSEYVAKKRIRRQKIEKSKPVNFSADDYDFALNYFNGRCAVCGRPFRDLFGERTVSMDHWIPLSSDDCPGTIPKNIVPLCHGLDGCNNKKGARDPEDWLVSEYGTKKAREILKRIEDFFSEIKGEKTLSG